MFCDRLIGFCVASKVAGKEEIASLAATERKRSVRYCREKDRDRKRDREGENGAERNFRRNYYRQQRRQLVAS